MKKNSDRIKDQKPDNGRNGDQTSTDSTPKLSVPRRNRERAVPLRKRKREGCGGAGGSGATTIGGGGGSGSW